jgi:hypothetical protein
VLAASYPLLDVVWTMAIFFVWVIWFILLFRVFADIFRRSDLSGLGKTGWLLFTILLPFLGVLIYILTQTDGMTTRILDSAQPKDSHMRSTAGSGDSTAEIARAKELLDGGTITQSEFDAIKQKALAA